MSYQQAVLDAVELLSVSRYPRKWRYFYACTVKTMISRKQRTLSQNTWTTSRS